MTTTLTSAELERLESIVTRAMLSVVNPWLTMDDMMNRYHVKTTHTITAMERRGEIPKRAKTGLWLRSEVNDWDKNIKMAA
jgi:predicted DNA-binding transcriptional regulator AlpA